MNKNALKGKARQGRITKTGKLPNSLGFPGGNVTGGGVIRKLTPKERSNPKSPNNAKSNPMKKAKEILSCLSWMEAVIALPALVVLLYSIIK